MKEWDPLLHFRVQVYVRVICELDGLWAKRNENLQTVVVNALRADEPHRSQEEP